MNFETAPIHPVAICPDHSTLAICNLPDGRVELYDVSSGVPMPKGDVPVGVDPVSVRFYTTNELWVVNHISSTVSVVDIAKRRVVATLNTLAGPADVVFAGSPLRAFVSCAIADTVQVFNPTTRAAITNIAIEGDRPKALAVSPDGSKVYAAIFESGNRSTILAATPTSTSFEPGAGPLGHPDGPYGGQNPPPNNGTGFSPPINPEIPEDMPPPRVSHIVKKNANGRWMDDNNGDWTEFVSGTNASVSGRISGWDMADHDVAIINTASYKVTYATGLMNLCMGVAVNPSSGEVAVVGTDGTNERRFEPNLRGRFLRVNLALVNPLTLEKRIVDLNPHLDYSTSSIPILERNKSIGEPRSIVWNYNGTRGYIAGMGSRNLVVVDANGNRVSSIPVELEEGPAGMVLDEGRGRLYVLNRFSASISVLNAANLQVLTNVTFFDPTPAAIRAGRRHFLDTRLNSGLGHASCASCHPDARMDRLAWDLGDPSGSVLTRTNLPGNEQFARFTYHPMKGPMVTQTLQDIIGHEPFHWRGDRFGIEDFNQTYTNLLGADSSLSTTEMQEFKGFLATIHFPPNRFRNFDDTLSTNIPLPREPSMFGNAVKGLNTVTSDRLDCQRCHNAPTGASGEIPGVPLGPNGERHLKLFDQRRTDRLPFKGAQLRHLADKVGLDFSSTNSRAGFGFTHDGRADTLLNFVETTFDMEGSPDAVDLSAFLFSFTAPAVVETQLPPEPPIPSRDVAASVGKQVTLTNPVESAPLLQMFAVARSASNRTDLVVRGTKDGLNRGWFYDRIMGEFRSDRHGETITTAELLALASPTNEVTFTIVPRGTAQRIGVDRDDDGFYDLSEIEMGFDYANSANHPANLQPQLEQPSTSGVYGGRPFSLTIQARDADSPLQTLSYRLGANAPSGASIDAASGLFTWTPPQSQTAMTYQFGIQVTDNGSPPKTDEKELRLIVSDSGPVNILRLELFKSIGPFRVGTRIHFQAILGKSYRLEFKNHLDDPVWLATGARLVGIQPVEVLENEGDDWRSVNGRRFYRVVLLD